MLPGLTVKNVFVSNSPSILCVSVCRLCGRVPFKGETAAKLEEVILQGQLTFHEIEWINTSQVGRCLLTIGGQVHNTRKY